MPETQEIVINTSPIIAIVAGLGNLHVLQIYRKVWVPFEVCQEISAGGVLQFALAEFEAAHWLQSGRSGSVSRLGGPQPARFLYRTRTHLSSDCDWG